MKQTPLHESLSWSWRVQHDVSISPLGIIIFLFF